ncbi:MAG: CTP synthase [Candidatus Omnitrophica bacterium]|mgnify:FL=1|nr:CTP synthase [Candidatus Omnitrophota bacterium]
MKSTRHRRFAKERIPLNPSTRFIFVTGGVCSSLGKGVACASTGCLLEARGYSVTLQKLDPYINVDPGTMSPYQHGEVYVTEDGAETDLDLGYYERFTHAPITRKCSVSTGQIYDAVIKRERKGGYLGKTVQLIPHITDEIKRRVAEVSEDSKPDFQICEIGGTVGDIEGYPFLEAIRQIGWELGPNRVLFIHLTLVPLISVAGEVKTKPTQHSVNKLREIGIQPSILLCRTSVPLTREMKEKIALFCNIPPQAVVSARDIQTTIYEIPLAYREEGLDDLVVQHFGLNGGEPDMREWKKIVAMIKNPPRGPVKIGVVGKYIRLQDAYRSLYDAIIHGGLANRAGVEICPIHAEEVEKKGAAELLAGLDGILVPWGFGKRGIEGKIEAVRYARERRIPFFGVCLGMQCSVIEFARHCLNMPAASSTEFDPDTAHPVISLMDEQRKVVDKGGTMRLGAYPCLLKKGTKAREAYGREEVFERHRHRWEFNNLYRETFETSGFIVSGTSPDGHLVEIVELKDHPWFLGCQFHPELKSRPRAPHPLFKAFIRAALEYHERISPGSD